jgi:hypothetical protein
MLTDYQKDVAGRFLQAMGNKTFEVHRRLSPGIEVEDEVRQRVEDEGLQKEGSGVLTAWFRDDEDAKWLEDFRLSKMGDRFIEVTIEMVTRSIQRQFGPLMKDRAAIRALLAEGVDNAHEWPEGLAEDLKNSALGRLTLSFETVLSEMRTHAQANRLIAGWVETLDAARDEFVSSTASGAP